MATMWPARVASALRGGYKDTTPLQTAIDGAPDSQSAPATLPADDTSAGQQQALATVTGMGLYGGASRGTTGASSSGTSGLSPIETAALNLQGQQQAGAEQDTLDQMQHAGVIPNPTDSPGVRANKQAYLTSRLAATYAQQQGTGPAPRAPGSPIYTGNLPNGSPGALALTGGLPPPAAQPFDLTQQPSAGGSANSDTSVIDNLVRQAHAKIAAANQPQYFTDPVSGQRFMQSGKTVMRDSPSAPGFPRSISAGGKNLTEVAPGKFVDEAGNPVSWGAKQTSAAKVYHTPAGDFDKDGNPVASSAPAASSPGTAPAAAAPQAPKAKTFYQHENVLDEMKRRGINR